MTKGSRQMCCRRSLRPCNAVAQVSAAHKGLSPTSGLVPASALGAPVSLLIMPIPPFQTWQPHCTVLLAFFCQVVILNQLGGTAHTCFWLRPT